MENALPVVLGAVVNKNNILLIKKNKSLFTDLWGLPSGKIRKGENIDQSAIKKIAEKAGIQAKYEELAAMISEVLTESGTVLDHFLIFLCRLSAIDYNYKDTEEGKLRWFDLTDIENYRNIIIPSDFEMIKKVVLAGENGSYTSLIEKVNGSYELKKFERF